MQIVIILEVLCIFGEGLAERRDDFRVVFCKFFACDPPAHGHISSGSGKHIVNALQPGLCGDRLERFDVPNNIHIAIGHRRRHIRIGHLRQVNTVWAHARFLELGVHRDGADVLQVIDRKTLALNIREFVDFGVFCHKNAVIIGGDVVVAACTTESDADFFGDLLATSFRARGGTGLIIDGGVRDTADLADMDFPVFATAVHARGTVKETLGSVSVPVVCAGAVVNPGDVVVADADGVVVVPREKVVDVVEVSEAREAKEARVRDRLAAGELGLDVYDMRDKLAAKGLRYNK